MEKTKGKEGTRRVYGILGGGVMGGVLFSLIRRADPSARILVGVRNKKEAAPWKKRTELVYDGDLSACGIVLLAVKPKDFQNATIVVASSALVMSVMAGVPIASIRTKLGVRDVARVMMNIAAEHGRSLAVWHAPQMSAARKKAVRALCTAAESEREVKSEDAIDQATIILGSGPAFLLKHVQYFTDAAQSIGIAKGDALDMARSALAAAHFLLANEPSSEVLITRIASRGGTTEAGLNTFEMEHQDGTWESAVKNAYRRAKELQKDTK